MGDEPNRKNKFDVRKFGINLKKYIVTMYLKIKENFANKYILLVFKSTICMSYITIIYNQR